MWHTGHSGWQLEGGTAAALASQPSVALELTHLQSEMVQLLTRAAAISCKQVRPARLRRARYICMKTASPSEPTRTGQVKLGGSYGKGDGRPRSTRATNGPPASSMEGRAISCSQISRPHPNRTHSKSIGFLYQPKKMTFPEPRSRVELFILIVSEMKQQKTSHVNSSVSC